SRRPAPVARRDRARGRARVRRAPARRRDTARADSAVAGREGVRDVGRPQGRGADPARRARRDRRGGAREGHLRDRLRRRRVLRRRAGSDDPVRRGETRRADAICRAGPLVIAALLAATLLGGPSLANLSVSDGSTPFAGDGRLLTTVSPNGDGFRDRAIVRFRLNEAATVRMDVVRTNQTGELGSTQVVGGTTVRLPKGPGEIVWAPGRAT